MNQSQDGGAFYCYDNPETKSVHPSSFTFHFHDVRIENSTAKSGGAIYVYLCSGSVNSSYFESCHAEDIGGAMISKANLIEIPLNINDCNFRNNTAKRGAALAMVNQEGLKITSSNFINNKANVTGGALSLEQSYSRLEFCKFIKNSAVSGGAVYEIDSKPVLSSHYLFIFIIYI